MLRRWRPSVSTGPAQPQARRSGRGGVRLRYAGSSGDVTGVERVLLYVGEHHVESVAKFRRRQSDCVAVKVEDLPGGGDAKWERAARLTVCGVHAASVRACATHLMLHLRPKTVDLGERGQRCTRG